jgi:hypothetical protein
MDSKEVSGKVTDTFKKFNRRQENFLTSLRNLSNGKRHMQIQYEDGTAVT